MSIPVFKPSIHRRDMHSVLSCLVTDVIGPAVAADELVATVAGEFSHEGGTAVREYVRAIRLVMEALALGKGDRVLISPLAPGAYGKAFMEQGVQPIFADVRSEDACLDLAQAAAKAGDAVKAVFLHPPLGRIPPMTAECAVPLVMDLGEALGARNGDALLGSSASYLILPMEPEGIVTTGGGSIVLGKGKSELKALQAAMANLSRDAFLPDLNASLGLVQWREYPKALETRDHIARIYREALLKGRHRTLTEPAVEETRAVPYSFPVILNSGMNEVQRYARKKGVETRPAFSQAIMKEYAEAANSCHQARALMMSTLLFPLYPTLGKKNAQLVAKVLSTLP